MSIVAFTLRSGTTQAAAPFSLGHAFKQGDVPAGSQMVADMADFQCVAKNAWPDGSLKFAVISGRAAITSGVAKSVTLSIGTPAAGTALSIADLKTTGITASIAAGAFGSASWSGTDWDTPFKTVVSGPKMSSWQFRKQIGTDEHLTAWLEVRLWSGGEVDVIPAVENGYLKVAAPTRKNAIYTFTLGGTQRFSDYLGSPITVTYSGGSTFTTRYGNPVGSVRVRSGSLLGTATWQSVDGSLISTYAVTWDSANPGTITTLDVLGLPHHSKTPLIAGSALSHWLGTDPLVSPRLDVAYLQATELVPTYMVSRSAAGLGLAASFVPLAAANLIYYNNDMTDFGYQTPIGLLPQHDVAYLVCADQPELLYSSVVRNGYAAGRYPIHYRDEATFLPPKFSDHQTLALSDKSALAHSGGSSTGNLTPIPTGGVAANWDLAHSPAVGFMAHLLTGQQYHLDTMLFALMASWLNAPNRNSYYSEPVSALRLLPAYDSVQTRSLAWGWRHLAHALVALPDDDTALRPELIALAEDINDHLHGTYVAQANNQFGIVQPGEDVYEGGKQVISLWQQDFGTAAFGYSLAMGLPVSSANRAKLYAFFQWKAKSAVMRTGTQSGFWYINAPMYSGRITSGGLPDYQGGTGPWLTTEAEVYTASLAVGSPPNSSWAGSAEGVLNGNYTSDAWAKSMWGNLHPALAYAARFSVPGAAEGLARITGASNYSVIANGFTTYPEWGVVPASTSAPAESAPMGPTLNIDVVSRFPGKLVIGNTGLGVLGKNVAGPVNGVPGYMYGVFDDVLHAEREVSAPILTRPSAGNFKADERGAYSFTDAPDGIYYMTFQPKVGAQNYGPVLTEELVVGGTQAVAAWTEGTDIISVAATFASGVGASIAWTEGADVIVVAANASPAVQALIVWTEGADVIAANAFVVTQPEDVFHVSPSCTVNFDGGTNRVDF